MQIKAVNMKPNEFNFSKQYESMPDFLKAFGFLMQMEHMLL